MWQSKQRCPFVSPNWYLISSTVEHSLEKSSFSRCEWQSRFLFSTVHTSCKCWVKLKITYRKQESIRTISNEWTRFFWTKSFELYAHQRQWEKKKKEKSPAWCSQEIPWEVSFFFLSPPVFFFYCANTLVFCYIDKQACWLTNHAEKKLSRQLKKSNQTTNEWNVRRKKKKKTIKIKKTGQLNGDSRF